MQGFGLLHLLQTQAHKISDREEQGGLVLKVANEGLHKTHGLDFFGIHRIGFKKSVVFNNHVGQDRVMDQGGIVQPGELQIGSGPQLGPHFLRVLAQKRRFGPQKSQSRFGLGIVDPRQQGLVFLLQQEDLFLGRAMQFIGIGKFTTKAEQQLPARTQAQKSLANVSVGLPGLPPQDIH